MNLVHLSFYNKCDLGKFALMLSHSHNIYFLTEYIHKIIKEVLHLLTCSYEAFG